MQINQDYVNKSLKLTQEQKILIYCYSKKGFTPQTLTTYISQIKNNKITMSNISYFEKKYFELFSGDKNYIEFFTACLKEKDKLQQEFNEIN